MTSSGLTLRVCTGLSCSLAGAGELLADMQRQLAATGARLLAAPCIGRCEQAPAVLLDQHAVPQATPAALLQEISRPATEPSSPGASRSLPRAVAAFDPAALAGHAVTPVPGQDPTRVPHADYATYRATGGYVLAAAVASGTLPVARVLLAMNDSGLRGLGGAGFPAGRKWQLVRDQPAPRLLAVNIDEGEPGTFQGPHLARTRPAPLPRGRPDRGARRRHRRRLSLRPRRVPRGARAARGGTGGPRRRSALSPAGDRAAPRRRRLHLWRGVGDDREHRGPPWRTAPAPAVRRAARAVRSADAGTQLRDAVLGARHRRARAILVCRLRPPRPPRSVQLQRQRSRPATRSQAGAGGNHAA